MFSRDEWLSRNQVQSYFSRLAVLKTKQTNTSSSRQATIDDLEDVVHEEDWLQQVDEVYEKLSVQHPIYYDAYNLCDLRHKISLVPLIWKCRNQSAIILKFRSSQKTENTY